MTDTFSKIDRSFIKKYNSSGPWYVCYPPVGVWSTEMSSPDYEQALIEEFPHGRKVPLYLYVHFPFCPKLCYYCHCHVVITKNQGRMLTFLNYLYKEIDLLRKFFDKQGIVPCIKEIHLGGGSPSVMSEEELSELIKRLEKLVKIDELDEFSIEIDIRTVGPEKIKFYSEVGIDRISFGIQDFDPEVQRVINRVQPLDQLEELVVPELRNRFKSINFDMIYGLPLQTRESFRQTIEQLKKISPDRICLYLYNHRPDIFQHQTVMNSKDVPQEYEKSMINVETIQDLMEAGYIRIGLDHFAKCEDDLAVAAKNNRLHRSFVGYTAGRTHDLIGIGPSSISGFGNYYFQNMYSLDRYYEAIDSGTLPVHRGIKLTFDQKIREDIILKIISNFYLDFREIENKYRIKFDQYFSHELHSFDELIKDGIIELSESDLTVTPLGKFSLRYICMVFDKYLQQGAAHRQSLEAG